jgi:ABC-2 type transport system permease protein
MLDVVVRRCGLIGFVAYLWRSFVMATWLEWQTEGNWTSPFVFVVYSIARPLAAALTLVLMYRVISGPQTHNGFLGYLIVGSACWAFVQNGIAGLPIAVLDDRERYAMFKYLYIAPLSLYAFLVGRTVPRAAAAMLTALLTLVVGVTILGVPIRPGVVNYPLLALALVLGWVGIVALGIAVTGLTLMFTRNSWNMSEAAAGALYLLTGAVFPLAVLPGWLQWPALGLPLTSWLELMRRALLGASVHTLFPLSSPGQVLLLNVGTTGAFVVLCHLVFKWSEGMARNRGLLDRTTGY